MGIVINSLYRMDGYHDRHYGSVTHNGNTFDAVLVGAFEKLQSLLHSEITAKFELNEIISTETNLVKEDTVSGIFALPDGKVLVDGTVYNETRIDDIFSWFDIYIQTGSDFLEVRSEDIQVRPAIDTRIRIVGKGLHVHPDFR